MRVHIPPPPWRIFKPACVRAWSTTTTTSSSVTRRSQPRTSPWRGIGSGPRSPPPTRDPISRTRGGTAAGCIAPSSFPKPLTTRTTRPTTSGPSSRAGVGIGWRVGAAAAAGSWAAWAVKGSIVVVGRGSGSSPGSVVSRAGGVIVRRARGTRDFTSEFVNGHDAVVVVACFDDSCCFLYSTSLSKTFPSPSLSAYGGKSINDERAPSNQVMSLKCKSLSTVLTNDSFLAVPAAPGVQPSSLLFLSLFAPHTHKKTARCSKRSQDHPNPTVCETLSEKRFRTKRRGEENNSV